MSDVLLVEDNKDTRNVLVYLLKAAGHGVCAVDSIKLALQEALLASYDVLISDISLPDGDGWELMRELRTRGSTMRGIAMSGHCSARDIAKSLESGFQYHLFNTTLTSLSISTKLKRYCAPISRLEQSMENSQNSLWR